MVTKKQKEVLQVINGFIINNKYSPSVRDLALLLNLKSTSTVQGYLDRLQAEGYIARNEAMPRTLHILKNPED
jgi:repressor LexA